MDDLVQQIETSHGAQVAPRDALEAAAQSCRASLQAGQAVDLLGLVRVHLTADGLAGRERSARALTVEPLPGLLPAPASEKAKDVTIVLAVESEDRFNKMLAKRLTKPGRTAFTAAGMEGVVETVKKQGADIVIMDSNLEAADEIRQWLKSTPQRSLISLIVIYGKDESPDTFDEFRICEDEFLAEPYEMQTLEQVIAGELSRIAVERKYFQHEVSFQFPTRPVFQQQAADFMERLVAHSGLSDEHQMGLVVSFREAVDNACRHGNKGREQSLISVAYVLDREKVTVTVEDEGPGFDASIYLDNRIRGNALEVARERHKEGRQGGLGIMLMRKSVDKLEYNREGNMVKLTKFLKKQAAVA